MSLFVMRTWGTRATLHSQMSLLMVTAAQFKMAFKTSGTGFMSLPIKPENLIQHTNLARMYFKVSF